MISGGTMKALIETKTESGLLFQHASIDGLPAPLDEFDREAMRRTLAKCFSQVFYQDTTVQFFDEIIDNNDSTIDDFDKSFLKFVLSLCGIGLTFLAFSILLLFI